MDSRICSKKLPWLILRCRGENQNCSGYENGRKEQVGMYLRNQNLKDKSAPDSRNLREECERIHGHIKNTVKFNVRRIMEESKELYSKFSFVAYQLLLLANLQNGVKDTHTFGKYI